MDAFNGNEGEKLTVSQHLTFEQLPSTRLEAKSTPDLMSMEMRMANYLREIDHPHGGDSSTDEYCVDLLKLAAQDNPQIWEIVQQSLRETVREWMELHPSRTVSSDSEENYVAQAIAKFSETVACKQIRFQHSSDVLKYLQASLNGVILDSLRSYNTPLREIAPPPNDTAESAAAQSDNGEVWETLSKLLSDVREQRMTYLLFHCGLTPQDIVHTFPEKFHDVHEIALLRRTIIRRMLDYVDQHDGMIEMNRSATPNKTRA
jgi:hypothetical protein